MTAPEHSADIALALSALDGEWRRMQLSRDDRSELGADVAGDLEAAAADGVGPAQLLGPDPSRFAREAAQSRGCVPKPRAFGRTLIGGVLGLVATAVVALPITWVVFAAVVSAVDLPFRVGALGGFLLFGALSVVGLFGTLAGVAAVLRGRWVGRATVARAAALLPVMVGVAGGIAYAFAVYRHVTTDDRTVLIETVIVTAGWISAIIVARWWALRTALQTRRDDHVLVSP